MDIVQMHVWFRQYAQQMGMQNVRAILPEQIDLLINTSIMDAVNQIITQNVSTTNDRVITDNSKIGQINALRSLYKVIEVDATTKSGIGQTTVFTKGSDIMAYRIYANIKDFAKDFEHKYLYLVDFSLKYSNVDTSTKVPTVITNYFPVRLIDDMYLADTLNDFILHPTLRSPIAVTYNDKIDVYIDSMSKDLPEKLNPYLFRVGYIAKPNVVKFVSDLTGDKNNNVDCDLPEHMHVDILKHAVDLYRIAVSGALNASQQAEQNQQRENARNRYRNEGNQQT